MLGKLVALKKMRVDWVGLGGVFLILTVFNYEQILFRSKATVLVKEADIPLQCYSRKVALRLGFYRSQAPKSHEYGYCGAILTDHGTFRVIEDGMIVPGSASRFSIVESLKPGCSYTIAFFGNGDSPEKGKPATNKPTNTIYRIDMADSCINPENG